MKKIDHGIGAIGLLILASFLAVVLAVGLPVLKVKDGMDVADWLGFAGSIIGGLMTLFAGWLAYAGVQRQLSEQSRRDLVRQQEAKATAEVLITRAVHLCSALIYAVRRYKVATDKQQPFHKPYFLQTLNLLKSEIGSAPLMSILNDLSIDDRLQLAVILGYMRNAADLFEDSDDAKYFEGNLTDLETNLRFMTNVLAAFDKSLGDSFKKDADQPFRI